MSAWAGSTRAKRLPPDWQKRRLKVLSRDRFTCQVCGKPASEVDHIQPGDNHMLSNLQALCHACHVRKTAREAQAQKQPMRRPPEKHPGLR